MVGSVRSVRTRRRRVFVFVCLCACVCACLMSSLVYIHTDTLVLPNRYASAFALLNFSITCLNNLGFVK